MNFVINTAECTDKIPYRIEACDGDPECYAFLVLSKGGVGVMKAQDTAMRNCIRWVGGVSRLTAKLTEIATQNYTLHYYAEAPWQPMVLVTGIDYVLRHRDGNYLGHLLIDPNDDLVFMPGGAAKFLAKRITSENYLNLIPYTQYKKKIEERAMNEDQRARLEFYMDRQGQHRWRCIAANNRIVADSGEGYFNLNDAIGGARCTAEILHQLCCCDTGPALAVPEKPAPRIETPATKSPLHL